jgi:uncharacterized protein YwgA
MEEIEKNVALITFYVDIITSKYHDKQVGKTFIQKIMYLSKKENLIDSSYSLYNYGPFSIEIANDIENAAYQGLIQIEWLNDSGYYIKKNKTVDISKYFNKQQILKSNEIANKYGRFNAIELSIITTAFFIKDKCHDTEEVVNMVHTIKPKFDESYIREILIKADFPI